MTPNTFVFLVGFFHSALCASFSNVVVRSGSEVVPLEYINYGGPLSFAGPQFAQLSAAPVETLVSLSNSRPCVSPCVIANTPISGLAPIAATANAQIVAYKSPIANVPIVLANTDDTAGYQYAYAVYDEGTGDKKTQSEQSDGSVVQGQYSFIQPDGLRREVVYTADDIKGFNAVVKTVALEPEPSKKESAEESQENKEIPCKKNEQLVEAPGSEEKPAEASAEITEPANSEPAESTEAINESHNTETVEEKSEEKTNEEKASNEKASDEKASEEKTSEEKTSEEKTSEENPKPTELIKPEFEPNALVSYSDIIDCIQSKRIATAKSISPLTYILIPAAVPKPC